jgi:FixJ family two-component response regulator
MSTVVWVVDDDDSVRGAVEAIVKELGYEARSFAKGEEALEACKTDLPDVVITDVRMPGMSGIDLTTALLEIDPQIIVMILTGFPSIPAAVEAVRAGATDFLSKPCRMDEIRLRISRAVANRDLRVRLDKTRSLTWALIGSFPFWFVLGILLAHLLAR